MCFFFFKQKTAYELRISDWSSDVCSSDLGLRRSPGRGRRKSRPPRESAQLLSSSSSSAEMLLRPCRGGSDSFIVHGELNTILPFRHGYTERFSLCDVRSERMLDGTISEKRRVGKECIRRGRSRWSEEHSKKKKQ